MGRGCCSVLREYPVTLTEEVIKFTKQYSMYTGRDWNPRLFEHDILITDKSYQFTIPVLLIDNEVYFMVSIFDPSKTKLLITFDDPFRTAQTTHLLSVK